MRTDRRRIRGPLPLPFLALEGLSMAAFLGGVLMGSRPLFWLAGALGSLALWVLFAETERRTGRSRPGLLLLAVVPFLVYAVLSFLLISGRSTPDAPAL